MLGFDNWAKMSQFGVLWRGFTCGYLDQLLAQYSTTNLPQIILLPPDPTLPTNEYLQQYFTVLSVVYWKKLPEMGPAIFTNPTPSDAVTFAKAHFFIPQPRLVWRQIQGRRSQGPTPLGGVPGDFIDLPASGTSTGSGGGTTGGAVGDRPRTRPGHVGPADAALDRPIGARDPTALVNILQTDAQFAVPARRRPSIRQTWATSRADDIGRISTH